MTTTDHTALVPALLYESLPKPSPYPFDAPAAVAKSRQPHPRHEPPPKPSLRPLEEPATAAMPKQSHPRYEVKTRIPYYPGVAYQAPTPGYPPKPLGAQPKPAPRTTTNVTPTCCANASTESPVSEKASHRASRRDQWLDNCVRSRGGIREDWKAHTTSEVEIAGQAPCRELFGLA